MRGTESANGTSAVADGPRFLTPLGFLAALRKDAIGFLVGAHRHYGDVVRFRFGPWSTFLVAHPEGVKHILHENHRNYWKGLILTKLKRIAGEGLVFSDGELWQRQRRLVQPAFHRERIAAMGAMMTASAERMLERWERDAPAGRSMDVAAEMSKLTLEIVAKALFGTNLGDDEARFIQGIHGGFEYANYLMNHFYPSPIWVPTRANRAGRRAIETIDGVVERVIERRRKDGDDRDDLLGMLLAARDESTDKGMDDRQLRDEIVTFLVAGHETTAMALSWSLHLLAGHPDCEARLHAEVDRVLGGRVPALSDLEQLPYTRMVLEESMRLYPPAWAISRESYGEDHVNGYRIPPKTVVSISAYVTHRHPEYWDDPEKFDPERFTPERSAGRPDYAYFPFGGGPRRCIGSQFALMEGQLVLAMLAGRFRLRNVPGHHVEPDPILTLRPRGGLPMTLERRD